MSVVRRAIRNLIRSPLRTCAILVVLAVSIGLALTMVTVHGATENQLGSIGERIGTEITVRPAGRFGMMGGGEPLAQEDVDKLSDIPHVVSVHGNAQIQYTGDSLESAVEAGTLGRQWEGSTEGAAPIAFRMGIIVMGFDTATESPTLMGDAQVNVVEGRYFASGENNANVMVVGQALADKNELEVSSIVDIEGVSMEVIGIYDSGQVFGNNMLVLPIDTIQRVFGLAGVTSVTVVVDYVDNVDGVAEDIRGIFDEDTADITTTAGMYERINETVTSASGTSRMAMIAAFIVAGVVILFSVVLMVRQRVKEIGILKAIGASNWRIGLQFSMETLVVSVVAAIIGALLTFPLAQRIGDLLVPETGTTMGIPGRGGFGGGFFGGGVTSVAGINVAVSPEVFLYALGIAIALAVAASIFPAWYISRVKPAEVLRYE